MMVKNKGSLDEPRLGHIAKHAVANSKDLLAEAAMLYGAERWARAGALAVLSVEESGKAFLCHVWAFHVLPAADDRADPAVWQAFWDAFVDHPGKVDLWLSQVDEIGVCGEQGAWMHLATATHLSKLACLYVDYLPQGKHITTPEYVTKADARQFMDLAQEASDHWDSRGWGADR